MTRGVMRIGASDVFAFHHTIIIYNDVVLRAYYYYYYYYYNIGNNHINIILHRRLFAAVTAGDGADD